MAQFSLYVHKGGLNPDSFHFICATNTRFVWMVLESLDSPQIPDFGEKNRDWLLTVPVEREPLSVKEDRVFGARCTQYS